MTQLVILAMELVGLAGGFNAPATPASQAAVPYPGNCQYCGEPVEYHSC